MRVPLENVKIFFDRRKNVLSKMGGNALILYSHPEAIRNGSVHHPFRQDSNLYYLTGFEEPETILVMNPLYKNKCILFVRDKDLDKETWDGFRFGPELTQRMFEIEAVYSLSEYKNMLPDILSKVDGGVYCELHKNKILDQILFDSISEVKRKRGRTGEGLLPIFDVNSFLGQFRVIKSEDEIVNHKIACEKSSLVHVELMKYVKTAKSERHMHGYFLNQLALYDLHREGYGTIVASGQRACTLHYVFNDQDIKDNELILIDAGGEYNYMTADITRTYPARGHWSEAQLKVYEQVLKIQEHMIAMVKPGVTWKALQDEATLRLTEAMFELGLFSGRVQDIIASGEYRKFYPHGIGHYLGYDVHDLGLYIDINTKESRPLESGMVLTIEPGLYISPRIVGENHELAGVGIRIEDNILVTDQGCENMTVKCPKTPDALSKTILGQ